MDFYEKYFFINLNEYPNIGIDLEINLVLFGILVGALIATAILGYRKAAIATVVKALIRHESINEESAKTLSELHISSRAVMKVLGGDGRLSKIVSQVGKKEYTYEEYLALMKRKKKRRGEENTENQGDIRSLEKVDFSVARFYIAEDKIEEARRVYDRSDSPILHTVLSFVLLVALFTCLMFAMPGILSLIDSIVA